MEKTAEKINNQGEVKHENRMGTEPVAKLLIKMSLPMMISMLVLALYNIVDSVFVAKLGDAHFAGVNIAFPFQMLITGVAVGTSVGVNSLVSRRLGAKDQSGADNAATTGIILAIISGLIMSAVYIFFADDLMGLFAKSDITLKSATSYLTICGSLCMFSMVSVMTEKILQATGNTIKPMIIQLAGAITNIVFDPILIFGYLGFPALGVAGAAYATVFGQFVSMCLGIFFLARCKHIKVSLKGYKMNGKTVKGIYDVGVASILMQCVGSFTTMGMNGILGSFYPIYGDVPVNVLGVYFKLQSFVFMPIFGLNSGTLPVMGYNYGARNKERFMKALKLATTWGLIIMTLGMLVFQLFPNALLGMFSSDKMTPEALEMFNTIGCKAFRLISICFPFAAFGIMMGCAFNAVGKGMYSLIVSAARQLVVILPAAYLLSKIESIGVNGVWMAYPLAEIVGVLLSVLFITITYRRYIKPLDNPINQNNMINDIPIEEA